MPTPPRHPDDPESSGPGPPADLSAETIAPPELDFPRTLLPGEVPSPVTLPTPSVGRPAGPVSPSSSPAAYALLRELGRGAMGVVYLARHRALDRLVALKMVIAGSYASAEELDRFRTEATAIARLAHPGIVAIYDIGEHNNLPYFAMEYCSGGSLAGQLAGSPLPPEPSARLLMPLARAMHHAHERGIVHRDLKPGNVLLQRSEGSGQWSEVEGSAPLTSDLRLLTSELCPKIADFGLARLREGGSHTRSGDVLGTPSYMAPEQAAGQVRQVGPATDVWALGAILYECLTGRPPFLGTSAVETMQLVLFREPLPVRSLAPSCPRDLETICHKCLQKDPARRYASACELADDLERFLQHRPIRARPVGPVARAVRWGRRHPAVAALLGLLLVSLAAGVAGWVMFTVQLGQQRDEARELRRQADEGRDAAERNFALAERRFAQARAVVDRYFTEVSESTLLHEPGLQQLRRALLLNAKEAYALFLAQRGDDPALRQELARSQHRLGLIEAELGNYKEAVKLFDAALARLGAEPAPGGDEARRQRAASLHHRARVLKELDRLQEAARSYEQALALWRGGARTDADRQGEASSLNGLGIVADKQERYEEAAARYREALALRRALFAAARGNETYQRDVAVSWGNLAAACELAGRTEEAAAARAEAQQALRALVAAYPGRALYQDDLGRSHFNAGNRLLGGGDARAAVGSYGEAVRQFEALALAHPAVPGYRARLASAYWNLALACGDLGQGPREAEAYGQALRLCEGLVREQPKVVAYQAALARSLRREGDLALRARRFADAEKHYGRALAALTEATAQAPTNLVYRRLRAEVTHQVGLVGLRTGRLDEAARSLAAALALLDEKRPGDLDLIVTACNNLGWSARRAKQPVEALGHYDRAWRAAGRLIEGRGRAPYRGLAAEAAEGRALALDDLGRDGEAARAWDEALRLQGGPARRLTKARRLVTLARTARFASAAEAAAEAGRSATSGEELFELGRAAARAAKAAGEGKGEGYLDEALALLRRAADKGAFATAEGRRRLGEEAELAPLRSRDEVKAWLAGKKGD